MSSLLHLAATYLAAPTPTPAPVPGGTGGTGINTKGILGWLASVALPILIAIAAVIVTALASGGKFSKVTNIVGIVILGVIMFGAAGALVFFGQDIVNIILG